MYGFEDYGPLATMSDAHREWHTNAGVPMGTPGCPQDACHPVEDFEPEPEPGEGVRCAHCKGRHWTVAEVKACAKWSAQFTAPVVSEAPGTKSECGCTPQGYRCSTHSWEYQQKWGRAENE